MKLFIYSLTLFTIITLSGCGTAGREDNLSESATFTNFSLDTILDANEAHLIRKGTLTSETVSEPPTPFFQKEEVATVQVDPANVPGFMIAVRSDIQEAVKNSAAKILGIGGAVGGQEDVQAFSIRYRLDEFDGVINVWGVSGEGSTCYLIMVITEN